MGRSQRHLRELRGVDSGGNTQYAVGDAFVPMKLFVDDLAGQTVNFATYFPTATNFAVASIPAGMSLNATTGLLNGTPTTVGGAATTLTVTMPGGATVALPWEWEVGAASVTAGAFSDGVAATPVNFATAFPRADSFAMDSIPTAMTFNATSGVLSGTPSTVEADASVTVTMYYTASNGVTTSRTLAWSWAVT